jgi:hypothetical protein
MNKPIADDIDLNPVPRSIVALQRLFEGPLADVRFPDVDGKSLAAAVKALADGDAAARTLEDQLDEARRHVDELQDQLTLRAQRALAYARVYAEGNDELQSQLAAIVVPKTSRQRTQPPMEAAPAPKKRGRKPASDSMLFVGDAPLTTTLASPEQAA